MLHQTFQFHDLLTVLVLIVLEGVLSVDNALVLGVLARRVPHHLRMRALTYGLGGALVFRVIAVAAASWLLHVRWLKVAGGIYLLYLAIHFFLTRKSHVHNQPAIAAADKRTPFHFWYTVGVIELTDIAFAVDSILAAVALVAGQHTGTHPRIHPKLWVVLLGGMLGVFLVRAAAGIIVRLLERFERLEASAYVLVFLIGAKLVIDWWANVPGQAVRVNFHNPRDLAFWVFWGLMLVTISVGFVPRRKVSV